VGGRVDGVDDHDPRLASLGVPPGPQ
jgi:hypothetical protein